MNPPGVPGVGSKKIINPLLKGINIANLKRNTRDKNGETK